MKNPWQSSLSLAVIFTIIVISLMFFLHHQKLLIIWLLGIAIGFVLYRSGICFAALYQNMFLFRDFSMFRAVIILIFISLVGISIYQGLAFVQGSPTPGRIHSLGLHTAVGGFLFGLGMVLAGSCASGTLQRIGEGFILFFIVLAAMIAGSTIGAFHFAWWKQNFLHFDPVFLPEVMGWSKAFLLATATLAALYIGTLLINIRRSSKTVKRCSNWLKKD